MKLITNILSKYKKSLGDDFESYHNHAQRVYALCLLMLLEKENQSIAIAAAFHDLDIWIGQTMDYLSGSKELAVKYLKSKKLEEHEEDVRMMISNHHKILPVKQAVVAEIFRKADLIDLTSGFVKFNLPKSLIKDLEEQYPRREFSKKITKMALKYAINHPTRPFPMLGW